MLIKNYCLEIIPIQTAWYRNNTSIQIQFFTDPILERLIVIVNITV